MPTIQEGIGDMLLLKMHQMYRPHMSIIGLWIDFVMMLLGLLVYLGHGMLHVCDYFVLFWHLLVIVHVDCIVLVMTTFYY